MEHPTFSVVRDVVRVAFVAAGQEFRTLLTNRLGKVESEYTGGPGVPVVWADGKRTVVHDGLRVLVDVPDREMVH